MTVQTAIPRLVLNGRTDDGPLPSAGAVSVALYVDTPEDMRRDFDALGIEWVFNCRTDPH